MLNAATYGKKVLTGLLNQAWGTSGTNKTNPTNTTPFPTRVYLGFSTTTPTVNASTGAVSNFSEPTGGNYARAELTAYGIGGNKLLSEADVVERTVTVGSGADAVTDTRRIARIRNHAENIMFPYTGATGSGYDAPIVAFGIFDAATGGSLIFWGPLDESVTVPANVIPLILTDQLELTLG